MMQRTRMGVREMSLMEVVLALAILTITALGVAGAMGTAHLAQALTKERQAVSLAATTMLDNISEMAYEDIPTMNGTGFDVHCGATRLGLADGTAEHTLSPGPDTLFPAARISASAAVRAQSGYVEVVDVPNRFGLRDVNLTIAWRTAASGSPERVLYTIRLSSAQ